MSRRTQGTHAVKLQKPVDNSFFSFIPKEKRKMAGVIAVIVLVILAVLIVLAKLDILRLDGHLRYYGGKLYGVGDNDIVMVEKGSNSSKDKYYTVGQFAGTDNYTLDTDYRVSTNDLKSEWKYDGTQADPIYVMYVEGQIGSASEIFGKLKSNYTTVNADGTEKTSLNMGEGVSEKGLRYYWVVSPNQPMYTEYDSFLYYLYGVQHVNHYEKCAMAYIDIGDETYALAAVYARADREEDLASDEMLIERCEEFVNLVSTEKPETGFELIALKKAQTQDEPTEEQTEEPAEEQTADTDQADLEENTQTEEAAASAPEEAEYVHVAYFAGTDKYAYNEEYGTDDNGTKVLYTYEGVKADPIYFMYVCGRTDSAKNAYDTVRNSYVTTDEEGNSQFVGTEAEGKNKNGIQYYAFCTEPQTVPDYEFYQSTGLQVTDYYQKQSYAFVETRSNRCVMVAVYAKAEAKDDLPSDEDILARSKEFIDLISK